MIFPGYRFQQRFRVIIGRVLKYIFHTSRFRNLALRHYQHIVSKRFHDMKIVRCKEDGDEFLLSEVF